MICTSITNRDYDEIVALLQSHPEIEMAEVRLDSCPLSFDQMRDLFLAFNIPFLATYRSEEGNFKNKAYSRLRDAIFADVDFVDVELGMKASQSKSLYREAKKRGVQVVSSWHNFKSTPPCRELAKIYYKALKFRPDVVKIVTTAHSKEDADEIISFYNFTDTKFVTSRLENGPGLIAFAMGKCGQETRIECLKCGAPFTFSALSEEEVAAPGQLPLSDMNEEIYGNMEFLSSEKVVKMPSSKSFAQRAIITAALAEGKSILRGYTPCEDSESAILLAKTLGAEVTRKYDNSSKYAQLMQAQELAIKGIGAYPSCCEISEIEVGESGLLARISIPLFSLLSKGSTIIKGQKTLLRRPLRGAQNTMASFGVTLLPVENASQAESSANGKANSYKKNLRFGDIKVPLQVRGNLIPGRAEVSGKEGSQIISGLLMTLPLAGQDTKLYVTDPKSIPYMFITLDVLRSFGVEITSQVQGDEKFEFTEDWAFCTGITFSIKGGKRYKATNIDLEGDWSAAANLLVAGAIFGEVAVTGLKRDSLQADLSILDILADAGALVVCDEIDATRLSSQNLSEPSAELSAEQNQSPIEVLKVARSPLRAFNVNLEHCPDLFPIVAVLAAFSTGDSHLFGLSRLVSKESNRAEAISEMLCGLGIKVGIFGDEMVIRGSSLASRKLTGDMLNGGTFSSHHDHRMVMALKVASLGTNSPVVINDESCVAKSFPMFNKVFSELNLRSS